MLSTANSRLNLSDDVAGWLELDHRYRIRGRYEISQVLVRCKGVSVWDADGKEYLDFESGQVCASTGTAIRHTHAPSFNMPRHLFRRGLHEPGANHLAKKLAEITPGELECSYFACTGSEATEAAWRLARFIRAVPRLCRWCVAITE